VDPGFGTWAALHKNEIEMAQAIAESIAITVREEYAKEGRPRGGMRIPKPMVV